MRFVKDHGHIWALRTGNVILAVPEAGESVRIYLVLTVWPKMQKPKPTSCKIGLGSILRFRACRLVQDEENREILHATNHADFLEPVNVLAMLDCESDDVNQGRIRITAESTDVILKMQAANFQLPELPVKKKKNQTRRVATAGKTVRKMIQKKRAASKKVTAKEKKNEMVMEKGESICADDIRRSASGRAAIQTVMQRFRLLDSLKFSKEPVFDQRTNLCGLPHLDKLHWRVFLSKAPKFYEAKFAFSCRQPEAYGERVFQELVGINRALLVEPPCRDGWKKLVHAVSTVVGATETL